MKSELRKKAETILAELDQTEKEFAYVHGLLHVLKECKIIDGGKYGMTALGLEMFHALEETNFQIAPDRLRAVADAIIDDSGGISV